MKNNLTLEDYYYVYNDYNTSSYINELYLLYLPLIEQDAIKIYQYFGSKILDSSNLSKPAMHYSISDNLGLTMAEFLLARKKLEALGLLETYYYANDSKGNYFYKIKCPLSFNEFFKVPMLVTLLKNKIGDAQYNEIHSKYKHNKVDFMKVSNNITVKFSDVYKTGDNSSFINSLSDNGPIIDDYYFDFSKLAYLLSSSYIDTSLDNKELEKKILGLAYLYQASPEQMAKGIENSLTLKSGLTEIDIEKLSTYLAQVFTHTKKADDPVLSKMLNKNLLEETNLYEKEYTEEELFVKKVDSMNYIEYLLKKKNIKISSVDAKNIQQLQEKYNFPQGVLNILLEYSIEYADGNGVPSYNYLDKVASGWHSLRLTGAQDAIDYVRKNKKIRQTKTPNKNVVPKNNYSKNQVVATPDYIAKQIEDFKTKSDIGKREITEEDKKAKKELDELLNKKKRKE